MYQPGLVSVIIPTHNRAELLKEAVQSVVAQTYRPIEIIVVDDGSTDATKQVFEEMGSLYEADNFQFKYIYQPKSGAPAARNTGMLAASGGYIQFLDSDDILYPEKLSKQVHYFENNPLCEAVFGDWHSGLPHHFYYIKGQLSSDLIWQMLSFQGNIANFSILMRKSLTERIGLWDTALKRCQEIDYHLRGVLANGVYHYQEVCTGMWKHHAVERIHNSTNPGTYIPFFRKWEKLLLASGGFSVALAQEIAALYMRILSDNKHLRNGQLIGIISEAVRLFPGIPFYNSTGMKFIRVVAGRTAALHLWLIKKRRTGNI